MSNRLDQPSNANEPDNERSRLRARDVARDEGVSSLQALQRVLYRSAKQDPTRRFHALYDKLTRSDVMWQAWINVSTNQGAPGVDGVSIDSIKAGGYEGVTAFLDELGAEVKDQSYRPQPLRRVNIPKAGKSGATRPLGIPALRDRVLMSAAKLILEPIFEAQFSPVSFGFRPKRSAHDALEVIRLSANAGAHWVLDADIKSCFDEIDHEALMALIERRVSDRAMLKLLRGWLRAGIIEGGVYSDTDSGTPQGSPISPLLCNIALSVLDEALATAKLQTGTVVRYADDWVVLCSTKQRAETARVVAEAALAPLGLRLHPDKTRIVHLTKGMEGFDFLGFHHRMMESWKWPGRYYLQRWPSKRAMASIRSKVREMTDRRYVGLSLDVVVRRLNPVLRGWVGYFRFGNSSRKFATIDSYVAERIAVLASNKHGLSGRNWATRFTYEWFKGLGVYTLAGNVRYGTAHAWR
ncbi:MAG TPA: group II intron reverse transcriptase/maturase [Acidimicrobiales bacterium]|nr:group II intron reverse transcriptase/maturase [Acidimicrobiales bacterium]